MYPRRKSQLRFRRGPIAQLVEQRPFKPRVPGSRPGGPSNRSHKKPLLNRVFCYTLNMDIQVGVLGSGVVGTTLANGISGLGYKVMAGNRKGSKVDNWVGPVGKYKEVANKSQTIILAVKGSAAVDVVSGVKEYLSGKTIIDTTNPIADKAPDEGVLSFFTSLDESLMERLQAAAPKANFVKAFSCVGNAYMVNPDFGTNKPVMFICGNDLTAKNQVAELLNKLGWSSEDFGGVKSARAIEPLCILWCLPGMLRNEWSHALTLLKKS